MLALKVVYFQLAQLWVFSPTVDLKVNVAANQDAKYFRQSFDPKLTRKKKKHKNLTALAQVVLALILKIITSCT